MNSIEQNILTLLKDEPQCAKNTTLLVIRYWMKIEGAKDFASALSCTSPETIVHTFRRLGNTHKPVNLPPGKRSSHFIDLSGDDL